MRPSCELFCGETLAGGIVIYIGNWIDEEIVSGGESRGAGRGFGRIGIGCCGME